MCVPLTSQVEMYQYFYRVLRRRTPDQKTREADFGLCGQRDDVANLYDNRRDSTFCFDKNDKKDTHTHLILGPAGRP